MRRRYAAVTAWIEAGYEIEICPAAVCRLPRSAREATSARRTSFPQWVRDLHQFRSLPPPALRERGAVLRSRPFYFDL